jgi:hypothetical protein
MSISDSEQYVLLDQLAEDFAARFRRGEHPALKEYTDRYPELAEGVQPGGYEEVVTGDSRVASTHPRQIGDYRILREVGRR